MEDSNRTLWHCPVDVYEPEPTLARINLFHNRNEIASSVCLYRTCSSFAAATAISHLLIKATFLSWVFSNIFTCIITHEQYKPKFGNDRQFILGQEEEIN
jgi:hypothetical protein